jgi:hypothetical protein
MNQITVFQSHDHRQEKTFLTHARHVYFSIRAVRALLKK